MINVKTFNIMLLLELFTIQGHNDLRDLAILVNLEYPYILLCPIIPFGARTY